MPNRPHKFRALSKPKHIHKQDHRHYWPYIPVLLLVIATILVNIGNPIKRRGVLAYATNMSIDQLLVATNNERTQNGAGGLSLNQNLNSAAQAKANDMIARNYWSHNTPDGQEPWIFIDGAGYKYLKAGENLAYGFDSSNDTVTGWMNSPTHRANLLDGGFNDVGFGFANGASYNNSGPETVVVAMYGNPQVLAASNQTPAPAPLPVPEEPKPANTVSSPDTEMPAGQPSAVASAEKPADNKPQPVTTATPIIKEPPTQPVSRIQNMTGNRAPWAVFVVGLIMGLSLAILLIKHAAQVRHLFRDGERFVLHHPMLDSILVSCILIGSILSKTTGFIR